MPSPALKLIVTHAGRASLVAPDHGGTVAVTVASIGVTATAFVPDPKQTALPGEIKRLTTFSGGATAADTVHITIRDLSTDSYSVRGIGLYLQDGTLFAVFGQATVLVEKSSQAGMLIAADTIFADITADSLVFGDTNFQLNLATTDMPGVARLATDAETIAGNDARSAVTPKGLIAALNERLGAAAPTAFAKKLIAAAKDADVRTLLGLKSAALKDEGPGNGLDADLLDGKEGAFYLSARTRYIPGQIIVYAGNAAPSGTLLCNGVAVSRATYADLFAAIGTIYGKGDGVTTFNVPKFTAGTTAVAADTAETVGITVAGAVMAHTHGGSIANGGVHGHGGSTGAAGAHGHSASSSAVGDHAHSAWTDQQGWHGHTGGTAWAGDHTHPQDSRTTYPGYGNNRVGYQGANQSWMQYDGGTTGTAGGHAHSFSTDGNGTHGHNVGIGGAGAHAHDITIGGIGDHAHTVTITSSGDHSHGLTINSTGGTVNLAAGVSMLFCIAY